MTSFAQRWAVTLMIKDNRTRGFQSDREPHIEALCSLRRWSYMRVYASLEDTVNLVNTCPSDTHQFIAI